jgi:hypothetical protein
MRLPSSLKLVVATWIAALLGAFGGRTLAEATSAAPPPEHARATVAAEHGTSR